MATAGWTLSGQLFGVGMMADWVWRRVVSGDAFRYHKKGQCGLKT